MGREIADARLRQLTHPTAALCSRIFAIRDALFDASAFVGQCLQKSCPSNGPAPPMDRMSHFAAQQNGQKTGPC
jgi:hypothetical protein